MLHSSGVADWSKSLTPIARLKSLHIKRGHSESKGTTLSCGWWKGASTRPCMGTDGESETHPELGIQADQAECPVRVTSAGGFRVSESPDVCCCSNNDQNLAALRLVEMGQ